MRLQSWITLDRLMRVMKSEGSWAWRVEGEMLAETGHEGLSDHQGFLFGLQLRLVKRVDGIRLALNHNCTCRSYLVIEE